MREFAGRAAVLLRAVSRCLTSPGRFAARCGGHCEEISDPQIFANLPAADGIARFRWPRTHQIVADTVIRGLRRSSDLNRHSGCRSRGAIDDAFRQFRPDGHVPRARIEFCSQRASGREPCLLRFRHSHQSRQWSLGQCRDLRIVRLIQFERVGSAPSKCIGGEDAYGSQSVLRYQLPPGSVR